MTATRFPVGGAGTGGAANTLTLAAGGALQPGWRDAGGPLTLQDFTAVKLNGGTVALDLLGAAGNDQVALAGTPTLSVSNACSLAVTLGYVPAVGDTFLAVSVAGSNASTGSFLAGATVRATYPGGYRVTFDVLYNSALAGGTGNDIVLRVAAVTPTLRGPLIIVR